MNPTITIRGREYTVTTQTVQYKEHSEVQYVLTGKRGAVYATMRNLRRPDRMFLMNGKCSGTMNGVWLTDEGGNLRVIAQ